MTDVGVWAGGRRLAGWLRTREGRWLLLLVVGALAVRLPFLGYPGYFKDLQGYVDWGRALNTHFWDFYRYGATLPTPPAYPPLAEYLFGFLTATYPALAHLLGAQVTFDAAHSPLLAAYFKVPLIACDLATVVVVFALARRVVARRWAYVAAAAYAFAPVVIFDGTVWGQTEAIFTLFVVLALVCAVQGRAVWAGAYFGVAVMCKPEAAIFGPLILLYVARWTGWRAALRTAAVMGTVAVVVCLPFLLPPAPQMLAYTGKVLPSVYQHHPRTSVDAFNAWYLFGLAEQNPVAPLVGPLSTSALGWFTFAAVLGVVAAGVWRDGSAARLYLGAGLLSVTFFTVGTLQHERYIFPAVVLLLLAAVYDKRLVAFAVAVQAVALLDLTYVVFAGEPGPYTGPRSDLLHALYASQPELPGVAAVAMCCLWAGLVVTYAWAWVTAGIGRMQVDAAAGEDAAALQVSGASTGE